MYEVYDAPTLIQCGKGSNYYVMETPNEVVERLANARKAQHAFVRFTTLGFHDGKPLWLALDQIVGFRPNPEFGCSPITFVDRWPKRDPWWKRATRSLTSAQTAHETAHESPNHE